MKILFHSAAILCAAAGIASAQLDTPICLSTDAPLLIAYAQQSGMFGDSLNIDSILQTAQIKGDCDSVTILVGTGLFKLPVATLKVVSPCTVSVNSLLFTGGKDSMINVCVLQAGPLAFQGHVVDGVIGIAHAGLKGITIAYCLPGSGNVIMTIYDPKGALVRKFGDLASSGTVAWDGRDQSGRNLHAGEYLCVLATGKQCLCARLLVDAMR
jgi:hypothetical protein